MPATFTKIILLGWLLPFGSDNDQLSEKETIKSLEDQVIELPANDEIAADSKAALAQYRLYLDLPEGDAENRTEAMRRLGDLSLRAGEDISVESMDASSGIGLHRDAISYYEQLLATSPAYDKADHVLYQLARAYESASDTDAALRTLDRLVKEYPDSRHSDEAQFRRGEIFFVRKDFLPAGMAYKAVIKIGNTSTFYEQSLYKHGWSQFKQGEFDAGIDSFMALLDLRLAAVAQAAPGNDVQQRIDAMSRPDRELIDDTLRVMSLTFSYLDGPASVQNYLKNADSADVPYLLYTSLGNLYLEQERYLDAASSFATFVQREPLHHNAPQLSMSVIQAYKAGAFPTRVIESKQQFVEAYGLHSDYWSFHDPRNRPDVINPLKSNLSDLAQYEHAEAQRTGDQAAYARAASWYKRYLDYFPEDPDSAQRSFLLAELLMESKSFAEANQYYLLAAYNYPDYPQAAEAGYAALLASRAHRATLGGQAANDWRERELRDSLKFAQSFPGHEQSGAVLASTAEAYYAADRRAEAVLTAGALLRRQPQVDIELRRVAWTVVAHGQFDLQHYARAERAYLELRTLGPGPGLSAQDLDERIAAAVYRQAEESAAAGNSDKAVSDFLRVATVAPAASIRATATYDAATLLVQQARWEESIRVLNGFQRDFPEHKFANDATQKLAIAYRETGKPAQAAQQFMQVAAQNGVSADVHREAIWTAASLYEDAGNIADARSSWISYVERFPQPVVEAIEVRQRLVDLAKQANDTNAIRQWQQAIIDADATSGAQRNDRTKTLAARATLDLAEPQRAAFNAIRLKAPLADSLKAKKTFMEDALSTYNRAAGYGLAEVTTVATYRIAEIYQQLSSDLMKSERPSGLSADELEQYDILLEEQAFPFEEKAIELYEVNAARAVLGVYDEWVAASFEQLAVLMPARYAKAEKVENYVADL
jgi:TolA-binding protein